MAATYVMDHQAADRRALSGGMPSVELSKQIAATKGKHLDGSLSSDLMYDLEVTKAMRAALWKLDHHQRGAFVKKLTQNPQQEAALLAKVKEALRAAANPMEENDAIVDIITQWSFEVGNTSQLDATENSPLSNGDPSGVKTPPSVTEGAHEIKGHVIDIHGTHPAEASAYVAGSGDVALRPSLFGYNPFNYIRDKFSGIILNSDVRGTHPVDGTGAGSGDAAGHIRILDDNPSNFHGDNFSGSVGNRDGIFHKVIDGVLLLPMGMIAEVGPGMIQVAGSTEKDSHKLLLLCIDISASVCFLSCCFGLLGLVMRLLDCDFIPRPFLKKAQKFSYIAATSSMVISMLLVLAYIPVALYL